MKVDTRNLLKNHNANPFHPEIANLIEYRKISKYNAAILAQIPPNVQLAFRKDAMMLNSKELETAIQRDFKTTLIKNILVIAKDEIVYYALVPLSELLKELPHLDINAVNGCSLEDDKIPENIRDDVVTLFERLGIIEYNPDGSITDDLKKYINPVPPFQVDDILSISL
jgi:hypothetical protein